MPRQVLLGGELDGDRDDAYYAGDRQEGDDGDGEGAAGVAAGGGGAVEVVLGGDCDRRGSVKRAVGWVVVKN